MKEFESFGECLARCLKEEGISASEAARRVGFRSRNSIFRILSGETSVDVNQRFFAALYSAMGSEWPEERWLALQEALSMERLGPQRYQAYCAFQAALYEQEQEIPDYKVLYYGDDGSEEEVALADALDEIVRAARVEIILTGCCESGISRLLAERCGEAGAQGRLKIRHYIDTDEPVVTQNILGILPLVSMPWYNARLVEHGSCPEQMLAIYRLHALHIQRWDEQGRRETMMLIGFDGTHFSCYMRGSGSVPAISVLDRWRFDLELLKPMPQIADGAEAFVAYTEQFAQLEKDCVLCSIKPDIHFSCIHADLLEQAVAEGFRQAGMKGNPELTQLINELKRIHNERYDNMANKHKSTHLVYSVQAMERFMRTGVMSDHFFIQRAFTVEERRRIIRNLLDMMHSRPWFNVHFLRENAPELRNEITFFDGKGVLLSDAYTNYALTEDHSEAVITLPAFMESFHRYFMDELLKHHVMSRADTLRTLERLLVMNVQE